MGYLTWPANLDDLLNLLSVSSFGEAEYWFAGIKVAAIVVFLVIVGAYVFKVWPNSTASFSNLTQHGGFLPHGTLALFSGVVSVIFSMSGVEVATIAAAESDNPSQNIRRAVNTVMARILVFSFYRHCSLLLHNLGLI